MVAHTYRGHVVVGATSLGEESVANFPGKDGRAFPLVLGNLTNYIGGGYPGLTAADCTRPNGARLVVAPQNLGDAPVGHLKTRKLLPEKIYF